MEANLQISGFSENDMERFPDAVEAVRQPSVTDTDTDSNSNSNSNSDISAKPKGKEKKAKKARGFILCDMCNAVVIGPAADHVADEHGDVNLLEEERRLTSAAHEAAPASHSDDVAEAKKLDGEIGMYALLAVFHADQGKQMFDVIVKATHQMRSLVEHVLENSRLYLFGSCVTMGLWDGVGDADYTLCFVSSDDPETKELSLRQQREAVQQLARKLRQGGFQFEELEPVIRTRVPVLRRKRDVKRPYELACENEPYYVEYQFDSAGSRDRFLQRNAKQVHSQYGGVEVQQERRSNLIVYAFEDGTKALKLFRRYEPAGGFAKRWKLHHRLPEVFSVDFDVSCRTLGVRNSWFLRRYMEQSPVFRAGNLFIKQWSKRCCINNSRSGFLTSYAMSVLWVYYLLRTGQAKFVDPLSIPEAPTQEAYGDIPYMPLWPYPKKQTEQVCTLGATLRGFYQFYAETFDWANEVVSLRRDCSNGDPATVATKQSLNWTEAHMKDSIVLSERVFYHVCIEDVYEHNLNLARHLSPRKADWFYLQFSRAWAWCNNANPACVVAGGAMNRVREVGIWSSLLSDGYQAGVEATLHIAVWRHLLVNQGSLSVGRLKSILRNECPGLLSAFELFHRFGELWHDFDMVAEDNQNNKRYGRRNIKVPPAPDLTEEDAWAAVSGSSFFPGALPEDRESRIVFLANKDILPRKASDANADTAAARLREAAPLFDRAASAVLDVLHRMNAKTTEQKEKNTELPVWIRTASSLVMNCFYSVDGLAFSTYHAKEVFLDHLSTVAETLSNPKKAEEAANRLKETAGSKAVAFIKGLYFRQASGNPLNPTILRFILSQNQYVTQNEDTKATPQATDLLRTHLSKKSSEEEVKRVSLAPQFAAQKRAPRPPLPIVRDSASARVGTCFQCGKPKTEVFATNQPRVDSGWYCMKCWSEY